MPSPSSVFRVPISQARLYCILDLGYTSEENAETVTASLLAGGADLMQLRAKGHDLEKIRRVAEKIIPLCQAAGVPFILNDYPALAAQIGADGVHIGQEDGNLAEARENAGRGAALAELDGSPASRPFIFGRSTHSLAQARAALAEGFDCIGFGPLFPTPTKAGRPAIGLDEIAVMEAEVGMQIPAFCIGGITQETLPAVLASGARRVVIVSALLRAPNIQAATAAAKQRLS